jgi:transposase-like protein
MAVHRIYDGIRDNLRCPYCDHSPVWEEEPSNEAAFKYYCHACNRAFDVAKEISDPTKI